MQVHLSARLAISHAASEGLGLFISIPTDSPLWLAVASTCISLCRFLSVAFAFAFSVLLSLSLCLLFISLIPACPSILLYLYTSLCLLSLSPLYASLHHSLSRSYHCCPPLRHQVAWPIVRLPPWRLHLGSQALILTGPDLGQLLAVLALSGLRVRARARREIIVG